MISSSGFGIELTGTLTLLLFFPSFPPEEPEQCRRKKGFGCRCF